MANLLRSLAFTLVFYLGSIPLVLAAFAAIPFGERAIVAGARRWARYHRWCAAHILGVRSRIEGVLPQGPVIVAFKHEAMFETIELLALFERPAVVFKAELMRIPVWGYIARQHGVIPVRREAGAAAMRQMLKAAKHALAEGRPIVIFPEGTRVPPGERPGLRPGLSGLYRTLGVPITPVALDSGRLWPRHTIVRRPGVVTWRVGEEIPPGLSRDEVEARVHAAINAHNS